MFLMISMTHKLPETESEVVNRGKGEEEKQGTHKRQYLWVGRLHGGLCFDQAIYCPCLRKLLCVIGQRRTNTKRHNQHIPRSSLSPDCTSGGKKNDHELGKQDCDALPSHFLKGGSIYRTSLQTAHNKISQKRDQN